MDEQRGADVHPELLLLFACSSLPQAIQAKKEKADRALLRRVAYSRCAALPDPHIGVVF